ncbi:MAG: NAD(P)-binding domain-containing protein, partial [Rhizomicrobium sp.]
MNIGILGAGNVAQALGGAFAAKGHTVKIGSRNPDSERLAQWKK